MPSPAPAPRICFFIPYGQQDAKGYIPSLVIENEPGHDPLKGHGACAEAWHWGATYEQARAICAAENARRGISAEDALTIVMSSMRAGRRALDVSSPPFSSPAGGRFRVILDQLPVPARPGIHLEPQADGTLIILEESPDPEDAGGEGILGVATQDGAGRWYLGCQSCRAEISETDSGMCVPCRQDLELREREERAWLWS
jgi:hypothetical protein